MGREGYVIVAAALLLSGGWLAGEAAGGKPEARGKVGAHVHSRFLGAESPVPQERLAALVDQAHLEVVPFGLVVRTPTDRAHAPSVAHEWLTRLGGRAAIPQLNTFQIPRGEQDEAHIRALFAHVAPVLAPHANVMLVGGANEPLTRGKGWASADAAEGRVRLEYGLWHEVSALPFCHKFTPPRVNVHGMDWARMEALWSEAQDAICYDWYEGNRDPFSTLDRLHEIGQRLGKPVVLLETAVPGNDPRLLAEMAERADVVCVYQLLATDGGDDERFAGWVAQDHGFREQAPGTMLRAFLGPPDVAPSEPGDASERPLPRDVKPDGFPDAALSVEEPQMPGPDPQEAR